MLKFITQNLLLLLGNPNSPQTFIKGLYRPNDITPYIHTLVYHIPEFLNIHSNFGIHGFFLFCRGKKKLPTYYTLFSEVFKRWWERKYKQISHYRNYGVGK